MPNNRKIKIYSHHRHYLSVEWGNKGGRFAKAASVIFNYCYIIGATVLKILKFIYQGTVALCFYSGQMIVNFFGATIKKITSDIKKTQNNWPKRLRLLLEPRLARTLMIFLLIALAGFGSIGALRLIARGLELKTQVLDTATLGNSYLSQAKDSIAKQDFDQAQNRFNLAFQTFTQGQQQLQQNGLALNQLLNLLPQKQAAEGLLKAAALISSGGQDFINLQNQIKSLHLSLYGITRSQISCGEVLSDINRGLSQIIIKLAQANELVAKTDPNILPAGQREKFVELKNQLQIAQFSLNNFDQVFLLAKDLLTGQKNVLLLFENNNELRASGGFMGTFGNLKIKDGEISKINVSSIYDLDGQLTETIKPPEPILSVSQKWFLRDSNWFADFPSSAKKISSFYEKDGGETPDLIIAITPNLIVDWLKITGPIALPNYGVTLTSDNFIEQTQVITSLSNGLPTNAPKQILADFVPLLLAKLSSAQAGEWTQIIQALENNLNQKQVVLYSRDSQLQQQLAAFHWDGAVLPTDRDYLSLVTSNFSGTKTDLNIDQNIKLTSNIGDDGSITDELEITRSNKMPDLEHTNNDSFLRIYVPQGSKLISNLGFDFKNLSFPVDVNYKIDDDVYNWEKNSVKDVLTGTTIGQESGKTFFGNWLNIKGGQSKTVKLTYTLPFKLSDIDRYSLLLQKQIGSSNSQFNWTVNFAGRSVQWKNFDPSSLNTNNLNSAIILSKDYLLGLVFQKR